MAAEDLCSAASRDQRRRARTSCRCLTLVDCSRRRLRRRRELHPERQRRASAARRSAERSRAGGREADRRGALADDPGDPPHARRARADRRREPVPRRPRRADGLHVVFLDGAPKAAAIATLDPDRSPGDEFSVAGREIYLSYPNGAGRTKLTLDWLERAARRHRDAAQLEHAAQAGRADGSPDRAAEPADQVATRPRSPRAAAGSPPSPSGSRPSSARRSGGRAAARRGARRDARERDVHASLDRPPPPPRPRPARRGRAADRARRAAPRASRR